MTKKNASELLLADDPGQLVKLAIAEWGGLDNFVAQLHAELDGLGKGHQNRIKVFIAIFNAILRYGKRPEEKKSLAEKKAALKRLLAEFEDEDDEDDEDDDGDS